MVEPYVDAPPWVRYRYNQAAPGMNFDTVSRINAELGPPRFTPYTGPTSGPTGYSWETIQGLRNPTYTPSPTPTFANGPTNIPYGTAAPGAELGPGLPPPPLAGAAESTSPGLWSALRSGGSGNAAINPIVGTMTYGLGSNLGQSLGRDTSNPLGRILGSTLKGAGGLTAIPGGGPVAGTLGGLTQGAAQAGFESSQGNLNMPANAYLAALKNTPIVGQAIQGGELLGQLNKIAPDWAKDYVGVGAIGDKVAGLIGLGGGGDSGDSAAAAQAAQQNAANEARQKLLTATSPTAMAATNYRLGITGDYSQALIDDFNQQVQLGLVQSEAGVATTVPKTNDKGQVVDADGKVVDNPGTNADGTPNYATEQKVLTPDEVKAQAYQNYLGSLGAVQAQQQQDTQSNMQAAAMQAAIAQYMPQVQAPGTAALNAIGSQLLGSVPGLAPGMQQAALNYATTGLNASDAYNTALTNSLAFLPQQMQQQAAAQQQQQYQNTYNGMLTSAQVRNQLEQQYPNLFPKGSNSSGSVDSLIPGATG